MISRERLTKIDTANFRHNLPKANEIVDVDLQQKRCVYPFKMMHHKHAHSHKNNEIEEYITSQEGTKF